MSNKNIQRGIRSSSSGKEFCVGENKRKIDISDEEKMEKEAYVSILNQILSTFRFVE